MKYLLIIFLLFTQIVFSQETPATFYNNRCEYKTDGTGKSLGLKIKLSVPCAWKQKDGERPHIVKNFIYGLSSDTTAVMLNMSIKNTGVTLSKADSDEMFTQQGLKELGKSVGTYISGRKVQVDGLDCGEVISKMVRESPVATMYIYNMHYYFVYKDKMIIISYAVGSTTNQKSKVKFESYKTLFRALAGSTVFISKWE